MRLDPALLGASPLDVTGANPRMWNSQISFGPWSTTQVREGFLWGFGYRLLGIEARYAQQPYQVVIASGDGTVQAECMTRAVTLSRHDLSVDPTLGKLPALGCGFTGAGEGVLRLHTTASNAEDGTIAFGNDTWNVRSVSQFEGSPMRSSEPVGYEIARAGDVIAAVETINRGRVWIAPGVPADERARIAGIAAVLLLYTPAETA
jgi:hypothetical protein